MRWVRLNPPSFLGSPLIVKKKNQNKLREVIFLCFDYLHSMWSFGLKVHLVDSCGIIWSNLSTPKVTPFAPNYSLDTLVLFIEFLSFFLFF